MGKGRPGKGQPLPCHATGPAAELPLCPPINPTSSCAALASPRSNCDQTVDSPQEKSWKDACQDILSESNEALHYRDIASEILRRGWRRNGGSKPYNTVHVILSQFDGFTKVGKGLFILTSKLQDFTQESQMNEPDKIKSPDESIITSIGIFWSREAVDWNSNKKIVGFQGENNADEVDFTDQIGLYILYDRREPIYIGKSQNSIGKRLLDHTKDRFAGRWDRFSWFGFRKVSDNGSLEISDNESSEVKKNSIIDIMESLTDLTAPSSPSLSMEPYPLSPPEDAVKDGQCQAGLS